jgi:ATP-dependent Lon protease
MPRNKINIKRRRTIDVEDDESLNDFIVNDIDDKEDFDFINEIQVKSEYKLRPRKKQKIIRLKKMVEDLDKTIDESSDEEYDNIKRVDRKLLPWKRSISEKKFFQIVPKLKTYQRIIEDKTVTAADVFESNMSEEDKIWTLEQIAIMNGLQEHTEGHYKIKQLLYRKIRKPQLYTEEDRQEEKRLRSAQVTYQNIKLKILRSDHSDDLKTYLLTKYDEVKDYEHTHEEYIGRCRWIDWWLATPTYSKTLLNKGEKPGDRMMKILKVLNKKMYGMDKVKTRIVELMGSMLSNPDGKGRCLAMVGPPGVGKTAIARCLGEALDLPFEQISLGGMNDVNLLIGFPGTYVSSEPGLIVKALTKFKGCKNGIIYFDEFDKLDLSDPRSRGVISQLLHIIDFSQNKDFRDFYLSKFTVDLSKILFVISLNNVDKVHLILSDRVPYIHMNGYTFDEKVHIGLKFMLPEHLNNLKIKKTDLIIKEAAMREIVKISGNSPGVRDLERKIKMLLEKINVVKHLHNAKRYIDEFAYGIKNFKVPFNVTKQVVYKLLS